MTVDEHTPLLQSATDTNDDSANPALDTEVARDEVEGVEPRVSMLKIVCSSTTTFLNLTDVKLDSQIILDVTALDRYLPFGIGLDDCSFFICCYWK